MGATVMQVLNSTVQSYPNKTAIKYKEDGQWKGKTWSHYQEEIILFGKGLIKLGLQAKEFITILSQNCKEWVIGNLSVTGNSVFNGNLDLGNASSDTVIFLGRVDTNIVPSK